MSLWSVSHLPRHPQRPNHPANAGRCLQSYFITPSLPWACLPFCGGGGLSLPCLRGWQHAPSICPNAKRRSVWCEHSERLCYNNSPLRVWLWLCHCRYILALCPRSVYHTSRGIVKGEYPFWITTAPRALNTKAAPRRPPISEQRKVGQQGKGGRAAHGGASRVPRRSRQEARRPDERRPAPRDDHRTQNARRPMQQDSPCVLQITSPKTPPFAGFFNSNNRERRTTHQRQTSSAVRTTYIVGLPPVPASHHSPPPAAAHQRRPPRRRGGTREHHQTGGKPAHLRRPPQLRGGHFSALATSNLGRAAHPYRSSSEAPQLDIGCGMTTAHPPQGRKRRPVGARAAPARGEINAPQ